MSMYIYQENPYKNVRNLNIVKWLLVREPFGPIYLYQLQAIDRYYLPDVCMSDLHP